MMPEPAAPSNHHFCDSARIHATTNGANLLGSQFSEGQRRTGGAQAVTRATHTGIARASASVSEAGSTTQKALSCEPCRFPHLWSFTERHQRFFEAKECLAAFDLSPCGGRIGRAHIIPPS